MIDHVRWAPLLTNLSLLGILIVCATVVYHGLREEDVGKILRTGLQRAGYFFVVSLLFFGVGGLLLAEWL